MSDQNPADSNLQSEQPDQDITEVEPRDDVPAGDPTASPNKDESASTPQDVTPTPEQTDNTERPEDGEQNVSQDPDVQES